MSFGQIQQSPPPNKKCARTPMDLAREFLLKSVVLGFISNEISRAELNISIFTPPPPINTVTEPTAALNLTWVN